MTVKDFLKRLKEAVGSKPWPTPDVLKDQVGIAFEAESRNRIRSRKLGEIDERSEWALKRELYAYGQALTGALGIPEIDRLAYDRVMEAVVREHNALQKKEKDERTALAHKKRAREAAAVPKGPASSGRIQTDHEGGFTLSQAFER